MTPWPDNETVPARIRRFADECPELLAVWDESGEWCFGELVGRTGRLAALLRDRGVTRGRMVGVCMPRGREEIACMLAVWAVGAAYVAFDATHPAGRIEYMCADSGIDAMLTTTELAALLPVRDGLTVVCTDEIAGASDADWPATDLSGGDLAYVIYTSGSTGRPKGTLVDHRNLVNMVGWCGAEYGLGAVDRCGHIAASGFDAMVFEVWPALAHGASVHVVPDDVRRSFDEALRWYADRRITFAFMPSTLAEHLLHNLAAHAGLALRVVVSAGDVLRARPTPDCPFTVVNAYGPTECTVVVSSMTVDAASADNVGVDPPIGHPIANTRLFLVDEQGNLVPDGLPGEIWVAGECVGRGYLNRPELTDERFVSAPFAPRAYRTGDLACRNPDGALRFLGRIDHQVKIRGQRVELGEVDAVVRQQAGIRDALTVVRTDSVGQKQLVTCVVPADRTTVPDGLLDALARLLPAAMLPAAVLPVPAFPVTGNGKIDRDALLAIAAAPAAENPVASVPDSAATDARLVVVWQEILGARHVDRHSHFFDLGGSSLHLTKLLARLRERFAVDLTYQDVFGAATPGELAALIDSTVARPDSGGSLTGRQRDARTPAPLSPAQEQLWLLGLVAGRSPVHNVVVAFRVRGALDNAALEWAVNEVVRRHAVLRTRFAVIDGEPRQLVCDTVHIGVQLLAAGSVDAVAREPFDLARGPLLRVAVVEDAERTLVLALHHLVVDGWSLRILADEIATYYQAWLGGTVARTSPPTVQYADYARWHRDWLTSPAAARQRDECVAELDGFPTVLALPTDRRRPAVRTFAGSTVTWQVPADVRDGLERVAKQRDATPFMALLAGFITVLGRWSGQSGLLVGLAAAGRTRTETEPLIGFFVNTLVIPGDLTGNPSLGGLLDRVRDRCFAAFARQDVPFWQLVEAVAPERSTAYNPLVQVTMTLQDAGMAMELPGATLERTDPDTGTTQFDLELDVTPTAGGFTCALRYATDIFDRSTVERLSRHLGRVWECLSSTPEYPLDEVELLDATERAALRRLGTGPARPAMRPALPHRLHAVLAAQPERIAVTAPDGTYTRQELTSRVGRIAAELVANGLACGDLVGVALPRGRDLPAALLAVWAAGAAYVPMDPTYPLPRLAQMAEDSGIRAVITAGALRDRLPLADDTIVIDLAEPRPAADDTWPASTTRDTDLAYVIFTSGSTGRPKGVMIDHGNLANVLDAFACDPGFTPDDRMLALTSLSFDIAGLELFLPLLTGGALIIAPEHTGGDPAQLHSLLTRHRATVVQATPVTWKHYTAYTTSAPPDLRQIWSGGERLPHAIAQRLTALGPAVHNLYGPTETTIWSTRAALTPDDEHTGIGHPVDNTGLHVVDQQGKPVPLGVPGELWISGAGVARGYLGRPELTAERFTAIDGVRAYRTGDVVRWRSDETLEYLHWMDEQVKIRGHRIEPGEVDAAVRALPGIRDACTVARNTADDEAQLVTYVVPAERHLDLDAVHGMLAGSLPAYMLPTLVVLDRFPLTPNGKIDRAALPEPPAPTPTITAAPTTDTERSLARIWCDVLGLPAVGRMDNFFAVGGHSLSAARVIARAQQDLGVRIGLTEFFIHPRLSMLAAHIDGLTTPDTRHR